MSIDGAMSTEWGILRFKTEASCSPAGSVLPLPESGSSDAKVCVLVRAPSLVGNSHTSERASQRPQIGCLRSQRALARAQHVQDFFLVGACVPRKQRRECLVKDDSANDVKNIDYNPARLKAGEASSMTDNSNSLCVKVRKQRVQLSELLEPGILQPGL